MGWFTGAILFVLVWWVVLFAVLPLGQRHNSDPDPVSGLRGAPTAPRVGRAMLRTTLVSLLVWVLLVLLINSSLLSFRHGVLAFRPGPEDDSPHATTR